jgi:hypothetical protein
MSSRDDRLFFHITNKVSAIHYRRDTGLIQFIDYTYIKDSIGLASVRE